MSRFRRTLVALVVGVSAFAASSSPADAYCTSGINRWVYNTYTPHVQSTIPSGWNSAISASRAAWNNLSGSALHYYAPMFNSNNPNMEFKIGRESFSAIGWPDVPGATMNTPSTGPTHTFSLVLLNSNFSWNTSGVMNQSQRQVDVRTIAVHEIGHASGLNHPSVCGAMTQAEIDSAMNPNWQTKQNINNDDRAGIASRY